jgi:thiamine biosynthesis protein ThiS
MITTVEHQWCLEINGERRTVRPVENVTQLLQQLGLPRDRIAVEVNRRVLRRSDWDETPVQDRDKVEIVQFVGGG